MIWAAIASAIAMTAIVAVRYVITSGGFDWLTRRRHPGLYTGRGPQIRAEIGWSLLSAALYGVPAGILLWGWDQFGWTRLYTDVGDYPLWWLPGSVLAYLAAPRHLVLLDPSLDAPPGRLSPGPRRPPRQPPADRVGGDELPSVGDADRRGGHPCADPDRPDPHWRARVGVDDHDRDGRHQSHGVGDLSQSHRSWFGRELADNSQPPSTSSPAEQVQLWPLFPDLGSPVCDRWRPWPL